VAKLPATSSGDDVLSRNLSPDARNTVKHRSPARRTLTFAALAAALSLGAAPAAHATWRTGNNEPPAYNDEHVCVDGIDWTFAWFAPPNLDLDPTPPTPLDIKVSTWNGARLTLMQGVYDLQRGPWQVPHWETIPVLAALEFPAGNDGVFEFHGTFRIAFRPGVRLPAGTLVKVTWTSPNGGGVNPEPYVVQQCTLADFRPPAN
jgi:hypothetical protein